MNEEVPSLGDVYFAAGIITIVAVLWTVVGGYVVYRVTDDYVDMFEMAGLYILGLCAWVFFAILVGAAFIPQLRAQP